MMPVLRRLRHRGGLLVLTVSLMFIALIWWSRTQSRTFKSNKATTSIHTVKKPLTDEDSSPKFAYIPCKINNQVFSDVGLSAVRHQVIPCVQETEESINPEFVYIPFKFIQQTFDVYGDLKSTENGTWFQWSHSYSKVYPSLKEEAYSFSSQYVQFAEFDVENRQRVKCVSATEGVPVSTQWDKKGYYYSTQIAQYALSHWSKHVLRENQNKSRYILEDGGQHMAEWKGDITRVTLDKCVHFDYASPISIDVASKLQGKPTKGIFIMSFSLQFKEDTVLSVRIKSKTITYEIKYTPEDKFIRRQGNSVIFGYGSKLKEGEWKYFTRDLLRDLQKGLGKKAFQDFYRKKSAVTIEEIKLEGVGCVTNISLAGEEHLKLFFHGADWLVKNQDKRGGWPTRVVFNKKKTKYPFANEIQPGWYSAMAQGHALSALTRAYSMSRNKKYLQSALRALELFSVSSKDGGFVTKFMNSLVWYEEYPTEPSTFVLNGFMYSLIGLLDLKQLLERVDPKQLDRVNELWSDGMRTLKTMLPFFDSGFRSVYDLRHFTMPPSEPKLARWDYHSTHVNLLFVLSTVDKAPVLLQTAERWRGYMIGKAAKHN